MHIQSLQTSLPTACKADNLFCRFAVLQPKSLLHTFALMAAAAAGNAHAQTYVPVTGGSGGGAFEATCIAPAFLTGVEVRSGDYVDALRLLCVTATGEHAVSAPVERDWYGGFGGGLRKLACPAHAPVVRNIFVGVDRDEGVLNDVKLYCYGVTDFGFGFVRLKPFGDGLESNQSTGGCTQGQIAIGLHGRAGRYIDALALICDKPPFAVTPSPAPKTITIKSTSTGLKPTKASPALAASSSASSTMPKSSGSIGGSTPASPNGGTSAPPTPPSAPSPPPPQPGPPSKQETRDETMKAIMGSVVTIIQEVRKNGNREDVANNRRRNSEEPRLQPPPRDMVATSPVAPNADADGFVQSDGSILVEVRYPAAYGYMDATGLVDPVHNSCGAFHISVLPASDVRQRDPTRIEILSAARVDGGAYVCEYMIYNQPISIPVIVRVAMADERTAASGLWLGGTQAQPPSGQRRTIADATRQVVLTAENPHASLDFEMVYANVLQGD